MKRRTASACRRKRRSKLAAVLCLRRVLVSASSSSASRTMPSYTLPHGVQMNNFLPYSLTLNSYDKSTV